MYLSNLGHIIWLVIELFDDAIEPRGNLLDVSLSLPTHTLSLSLPLQMLCPIVLRR